MTKKTKKTKKRKNKQNMTTTTSDTERDSGLERESERDSDPQIDPERDSGAEVGTQTENDPAFTNKDPQKYDSLLHSVCVGNWDLAKNIFGSDENSSTARITMSGSTALMIAAWRGNTLFVERLSKLMHEDAVLEKGYMGNTALHYAAMSKNTRNAKALLQNNRALLSILNDREEIPLVVAASYGHKDMVEYLYSETRKEDLDPNNSRNGFQFLEWALRNELYDVALRVLRLYPKLGAGDDNFLDLLAEKPSSFESGSRLGIWQRIIYKYVLIEPFDAPRSFNQGGDLENPPPYHGGRQYITRVLYYLNGLVWKALKLAPGMTAVRESKLKHKLAHELVKLLLDNSTELQSEQNSRVYVSLRTATQLGIVEIVSEIMRSYPLLIMDEDGDGRNMYHYSIRSRQEKILKVIHEQGLDNNYLMNRIDNENNTILHLAALLAPPRELRSVSGAALQMQRELQWFGEVERLVQPCYKEFKNSEEKTPQEMFTEQHAELVKDGEKWMKDTATSCMLVATLIATVMFASAFTVPGGYINDNGNPIFLQTNSFLVFAISDVVALFSSTASILMFLSILTSRYSENDFLHSLPKRLIIGLTTLFLSMVAMIASFSATIFIMLHPRLPGVIIPVSLLACVPVTLFVLVQFPLLVDIFKSTYGSGVNIS